MAALADAPLVVERLNFIRRSTAITRAVVRTVTPTGVAERCRISTSVPTVTQPGWRQGLMASAEASSISRIIIGVA